MTVACAFATYRLMAAREDHRGAGILEDVGSSRAEDEAEKREEQSSPSSKELATENISALSPEGLPTE